MASVQHDTDRGPASVPARVGDCSHDLRVVGYVRPSETTRTDCDQPLRAVCRKCGWEAFWRCDCTSEERCRQCSERKRKLIARLVDLGCTKRIGAGFAYFLTLNGPGDNPHRRWVQGRIVGQRPVCGCETIWQRTARGVWNKGESGCWNRLRTALARLDGSLTYIGAVEAQKRGVLHRHVVLNVSRPLQPAEVQALALAAGYGCVFDLQLIQSAGKAAWYISKYVTKSAGARKQVPWIAEVVWNQATGESRPMRTTPTFRTWSSAQSWGFTIKGLKAIARQQAQAREMYLRELGELLGDQGALGTVAPAVDNDDCVTTT
jgi:hypothetical protein